MSDLTKQLAADFLDDLAEIMGNAGCNDYDAPKKYRKHILALLAKHNDDPDSTPADLIDCDFAVVHAIAAELREES